MQVSTSKRQQGYGRLIVNADDWGRDQATTDRTLECVLRGGVSAASAMMFMEDSERSTELAREHNLDIGLHLNLTEPFATVGVRDSKLKEHHRKVIAYLRRHRLAQIAYNPVLSDSFEFVVARQLEEFERLYGAPPCRVDGHHHMHLSANVLWSKLIPPGVRVRRNFSFLKSEKGKLNRMYRNFVDRALERRHVITDYFFSLPPLQPKSRLDRIFSLALSNTVEVETHPINAPEYQFLMSGLISGLAKPFAKN